MRPNQPYLVFRPEFKTDQAKITNFLRTFETPGIEENPIHGRHKYMIELQKIANRELKVLEIHKEDLEEFFSNDLVLLNGILKNTKRYISIFFDAVDLLIPPPTKKFDNEEAAEEVEEILYSQRVQNIEQFRLGGDKPQGSLDNQAKAIEAAKLGIPKELLRKYEIIIIPGPGSKGITIPMRTLRATQIGALISIKGIVVRATDVKPKIQVACYSCDVCGYENYQVVQGRTYMPLVDCTSEQCKNNRSHGKISQMNRTSKFVSFQEIRIQEPNHEVPVGRVPCSMTVFAIGNCVKQCIPGDTVTVIGVFLPNMVNGARYRSRLVHDTFIEAFKIIKEKKNYSEGGNYDEEIQNIVKEMGSNKKKKQNIYDKIYQSIAPEIFGMEDIKRALLLLLVGGVDKTMEDGMKIRGNINILLMGDPGIAKSQLLKYICHLSPRGVYTTGKGSSGVGLTAAVVKDPITNDLVLEGGALVLADMGVCCIDEFDKMSDYDRANIHEVMEQQTVSIAKAGITTRLNARTSILAAANPIYGRYNENLTPHENINLPAALLSRFDLVFLLLDRPQEEKDRELAKHVAYVHQHSEPPQSKDKPYSSKTIRAYIANAKKYNPIIPKDLHNFIIQKYVEKRKAEKEENKEGYQYITPRSLLAIIRLAQALGRLRLSDEVNQDDVDEALRLVEVSKSSVDKTEQDEKQMGTFKPDVKSQIFKIVRDFCLKNDERTCSIEVIERNVTKQGFSKKQFKNMLEEYKALNILYVDVNQTEVTLL